MVKQLNAKVSVKIWLDMDLDFSQKSCVLTAFYTVTSSKWAKMLFMTSIRHALISVGVCAKITSLVAVTNLTESPHMEDMSRDVCS